MICSGLQPELLKHMRKKYVEWSCPWPVQYRSWIARTTESVTRIADEGNSYTDENTIIRRWECYKYGTLETNCTHNKETHPHVFKWLARRLTSELFLLAPLTGSSANLIQSIKSINLSTRFKTLQSKRKLKHCLFWGFYFPPNLATSTEINFLQGCLKNILEYVAGAAVL